MRSHEKCPFDNRPAVDGWRDMWREPLCAKCSAYLMTMMQDQSRTLRDEIAERSRTSARDVESN